MKDYRKTHQERENKPGVRCHSWSVLFKFHGVAALLIVACYNSSAAIKHARNLPRHMQQVHGQCKDHFFRVSIYHSLLVLSGSLYHAKETSEAHRERRALPDNEEMMGGIGIPMAQTVHMRDTISRLFIQVLSRLMFLQRGDGIPLRHTVFLVVQD